jgi:hypothetical protein
MARTAASSLMNPARENPGTLAPVHCAVLQRQAGNLGEDRVPNPLADLLEARSSPHV